MSQVAPQQGGGSITGPNEFVSGNTQAAWVTVYTFLILWVLSLLFVSMYRSFFAPKSAGGAATTGGAAEETGGGYESPMGRKLRNGSRASRDAFLILLGTTLINQAGNGISGGVVALIWIVFGIFLLWTLMHYTFYNPIVDFLLTGIWGTLTVINFGLAFRNAA